MVDADAARTAVSEPSVGEAGAPRPGPFRRHRLALALCALVAACGVGLQYVLMVPPLYFDPYYVWLAARDWPHIPLEQWPFSEVPHQVTRVGLVLPARLAQEVLGPGQIAYFTVTAVGVALFFVGCFLAVRSLFGNVAGLASVLVILVNPLFTMTNPYGHELGWSTGVMLPDMPGAGLFSLGMAALVTASRRTGRDRTRWLVAAGTAYGLAFLSREFVALMFVVIPVFLVLLRIPWRRNITIGIPMAVVFGADFVHNQIVWGNPLAGIISAAEHGGLSRDRVTRTLAAESFTRAFHDWSALGSVFIAALALTVVGWAATRDRRLLLVLVWFLALGVPITLLSGVLNPQSISLRAWLPRYWDAVLPALLAGGFGTVALLWQRVPDGPRRRLRTPAAALAVVVAASYVVVCVRAVPDLPRDTAWNELRTWLRGRNDITTIYSDRRLAQTLTFYVRDPWGRRTWNGRIESWPHDHYSLPVEAFSAPVLWTRWRGQEAQVLGGWRPRRAKGWQRLWKSSDGVLQIWDHPSTLGQVPPKLTPADRSDLH
ncbi:ArnT family glycosyltransferase [Actinomadura gamaensis]|uniref:ArnT family glycosyltransferase n=1 Tax=Actinomadura gamaensis TaxID=1763541 RepID=A0ABV9U6I3_9ACTN